MRLTMMAALAAVLAACSGDDDGGPDGAPDASSLFVVASDFASSVYGWVPLDDPTAFNELGPADGDTVAVRTGGRLVVIERTLGALTVLTEDGLGVESNFSVAEDGAAAPNPQDIAIVDDGKAYVTRFALGSLAIVDPVAGEVTGSIDLADEDPDGVPDMTGIAIVGDRALVALELLDETFSPRGPGRLVVVDTASDEVVDRVELPVGNPLGRLRTHGGTGEVVVACVGAYSDPDTFEDILDGAIVALGADGDAPRVLVDEEALGGNVGSFAIASETQGWAIVASAGLTSLVPFDPSTGEVGAPLIESAGYDLRDLELAGDRLFVADGATETPGLRVFDLAGTELLDEPVDVGLPPATLVAF